MRFGSVCSGIEAASVAWHPLGWQAAWLAEIEPFPSAVLKHHYPDVPNYGDMTQLPERIRGGEVEAPDLFCGGTPCQAFSVAGKRQSLADARGNLSLTFCDIADAIDESRSVRGLPATIVFWENVPGVLSTSDNAFGCFLAQLCGGDEPLHAPDGWPDAGCVSGPRRTAAWRILDAQYFGLAQRRRRVFVVASAREGFDPAAVLFEFDGVRRDTAPSREAGQAAARSPFPSVAGSLDTQCGSGKLTQQSIANGHLIGTITARMFNSLGPRDVEEVALLPVAIQGNLIGRDAGGPHGIGASTSGLMYTLTTADVHGVAMQPIAWDEELNASVDQAGTLLRGGDGGRHDGVLAPTLTASNDPSRSPQSSEITAQVAAVFEATAAVATGFDAYNNSVTGDIAKTLDVGQDHHHVPLVQQQTAMQVRRLTPTECERLQGFPDGYTAIPWRGKPASECPDGPRYKALGNSWAVPVVRWIGKRIQGQV